MNSLYYDLKQKKGLYDCLLRHCNNNWCYNFKLHNVIMRNSHKLILAAVMIMLFALKPDLASFVPQWAKLAAAGVLLLLGFYAMWKERQW